MLAVIDAVYGGMARVMFGEYESVAVDVPVRELPGGAHAGMVLRVKFTADEGETRRRRAQGESPDTRTRP